MCMPTDMWLPGGSLIFCQPLCDRMSVCVSELYQIYTQLEFRDGYPPISRGMKRLSVTVHIANAGTCAMLMEVLIKLNNRVVKMVFN